MRSYIDVAIEAVREAGAYLLEHKGSIKRDDVDEKARNDFVTFVDRNSEKLLIEKIRSAFPEHYILAEEGGQTDMDTNYRWIIDPLDGTKNFIQDVPFFCVSIALQKGPDMLVGVVYDPVHDELFSAEKGGGAYLNGQPIKVSHRPFHQGIIATGFPFKYKAYLPQYLKTFQDIFLKCSGIRRCGSAALDLCYTAAGRFEGFWELGLSPWDIAAGSLLVKEAGGVVTDFWGTPSFLQSGFVIAGNEDVQQNIQEIVNYHFPHQKH